MNDIDPELAAAYVQATTGRRPDPAAATRMANSANAVKAALRTLAADPLMDTEPANLEQVLSELAEPPDSMESKS